MSRTNRMAHRVFIILAVAAIASASGAAAAATWSRKFPGFGGLVGGQPTEVQLAADGRILVVGTNGTTLGVAALDPDGTPLWANHLSAGGEVFRAACMTSTADGGLVVAADLGQSSAVDTVLIRFDAAGTIVWQTLIAPPGVNRLAAILETANGDILGVGEFQQLGTAQFAGWVIRLSASGSALWSRVVGMSSDDVFFGDVIEADGGGFLAVGTAATSAPRNGDALVVRLDANGGLVWEFTLGGRENDSAHGLTALSGGDYVFVGTTTLARSPCLGNPLLVRFDRDGIVAWQETVSTPAAQCFESPSDIAPSADGGFAWSGNELHVDNSEVGIILAFTASGGPLWKVRDTEQTRVFGLQPGPAGGYVSCGPSSLAPVVSVLASDGLVAPNCPNVTSEMPSVAPFRSKSRQVNLVEGVAPVTAEPFSASTSAVSLSFTERCAGTAP